MKIALLHYTCSPVVGGVENVLAEHARLLAKAGHEVTVLAGRGGQFDERIRVRIFPRLNSRHAEVLRVKAALDLGKRTPAFDKLCEQIGENLLAELKGFDLLVAHNVASLHKNLPLTAALHKAYLTPGFPHLILWHHDLAWMAPRYRSELHDGYPWDLLCSRWEGVSHVTISDLRCRELSKLTGIPGSSIRVIPNGVDLNVFFKLEAQTIHLVDLLDLVSADPLLLLPVRITPRKNIELALQVLKELRKKYPRAALLVTGPEGPHNPANAAYKQKLLDLRDELGLHEAAYFLAETSPKFIPDAVISDLYRLADALLFPSFEEGFGIPILEAGITSMPIFCADIPALCELGQGDVSYFGPDAAPGSIAQLIQTRLEGEATSRWARRAKHGFSWAAIFSGYIAPLIEEVTK
jgi:mannosylglucosylglycerate synthase